MSTYLEMLDAVKNYYGSGSDQWVEIAKYGISANNAESILSQVPGVNLIKNSDGSIRSYTLDTLSSIKSGTSVAEELNSNLQSGTASIANNTMINVPSNMGINEGGKLTLKSGMKTTGDFVFSKVIPAIAAASVGISLGKTIDKTLYNLNPNFWDENNMSTLNPDTWNSITSGDNSTASRLFNMVFGIDGDDTQAYIDENAYAYFALWLQQQGIFDIGPITIDSNLVPNEAPYKDDILSNLPFYETFPGVRINNEIYTYGDNASRVVMLAVRDTKSEKFQSIMFYSENPFKAYVNEKSTDSKAVTFNGITYYYVQKGNWGFWQSDFTVDRWNLLNSLQRESWTVPYIIFNGTSESVIDGIGNQQNANSPNLSGITSIEDSLTYLKSKYPELWNNAVEQEVVQQDGSITTYSYIPIPMPEGKSGNDTEPISGEATQTNTSIKDTSTQTLIDLITSIITTPPTNTDIPDTGSGDTPPVIIPSGSASALYSIYNPTQEELNNFGSWLWSANFVDQLLKMFNDPMQSIIGLHKVFAHPIISGRGNIKVGYLDSGIDTNLVSNQYVSVDCGSVSIKEYFGNVFDYYPYTKIQLYLPFIGIVDLDTSDTMRSTLNIKYHIDVLTGACLAEVNITRDAHGGILYTYNGNCAVQYPLSSGSYMGIVTGIISAGIGVAVGVSGNPLLGAGITLSGINGIRTDVKHSGNLSGNAGAMGIKKPYIIITRPQTHVADEVEKFTGYPTNNTVTLYDLNGYVKINYVHVEEIEGAFNSEKDEIERLLKEGVIIA